VGSKSNKVGWQRRVELSPAEKEDFLLCRAQKAATCASPALSFENSALLVVRRFSAVQRAEARYYEPIFIPRLVNASSWGIPLKITR
jgi:hypothetical protein